MTTDRRAALESVFRLLMRLAGQRAERGGLDRDDLFGEACVIFLARFDRYDPARGSLTTWAGECVRAAYVRLMRQQQRSRRAGLMDTDTIEQLHTGYESDPSSALVRSETLAGLRNAVGALPSGERLLIQARYGLGGGPGRTVAAAGASIGGVSRERAHRMHRRALGRLKTALRG